MHILILASLAESVTRFRGPLIRDIVAAGHEVSVGAPGIDGSLRSEIEALGVRAFETPLLRNKISLWGDLDYHNRLYRLMKRLKPNLVLTYTIKPNIWGAIAARRAGIPSSALITGLGFAFAGLGCGENFKARFSGIIARKLYGIAAGFHRTLIFQNPDDRADFIAAGCLKDETKCEIVNGSGVDLQHYCREPKVELPSFLLIARLLYSKGIVEYAEAADQLRRIYPSARFVLVGPHDRGMDAINVTKIEDWKRRGTLEYEGSIIDVRPYISQASVYVLPSYREGTPRSVLEAMAAGRPIITTDVPGCRETVQLTAKGRRQKNRKEALMEGENGFLVEVKNVDALVTAMKRFIETPSLIKLMGDRSREFVEEKFDVNKVNAIMMRILGL